MVNSIPIFSAPDPTGFPDFGAGALLSPEATLCDAIEEGNYPRAYMILRKLDRPLEGDRAADCLIRSFFRTGKLFRTVLAHLSPKVRTGSYSVHSDANGSVLHVRGTLLVLAAAIGSGSHVEALLSRGFDVNASTPESIVFDGSDYVFESLPYGAKYRFCAAPGNAVTVTNCDERSTRIVGCTPLAAAIAAGNVLTYDVLLRSPGVWKTESTAVCRAAALHADGRSFNNDWVLPWDGSQATYCPEGIDPLCFVDVRDVLFPYVNMQAGSFADMCSPGLLQKQFQSGKCTDADARAVLEALDGAIQPRRLPPHFRPDSPGSSSGRVAAKLLLTAKYFPAVCREPEACAVFLRAYIRSLLADQPQDALLQCWQKLSGKDRDISGAARLIFHLRGEALKNCLAALSAGGSLYASADTLHPCTLAELRETLRRVRVVPSPFRTGISDFAKGVLSLSPDVRVLRKLFQGGPLSAEPKDALLLAADIRSRPLILTSSFSEPEKTYDPTRSIEYVRHDSRTPESARAALAERLLHGQMREAECLLYLNDPEIFDHCCTERVSSGFPELESGGFQQDVLCAENPAALRAWLRTHPDTAGVAIHATLRGDGDMRSFFGPSLAVAAAAGRTENVRTLLAVDPRPDVCCYATLSDSERGESSVPCTPFLLALWFGREETAHALLEAGAVCALDREPEYCFFLALPPEGRALAARLPGIGYADALRREAKGDKCVMY